MIATPSGPFRIIKLHMQRKVICRPPRLVPKPHTIVSSGGLGIDHDSRHCRTLPGCVRYSCNKISTIEQLCLWSHTHRQISHTNTYEHSKHDTSQKNLQSHTCRFVTQISLIRSRARTRSPSENEDPHSLRTKILEASPALFNLGTCTINSSMVKSTRVTVEIHLPEVLSLLPRSSRSFPSGVPPQRLMCGTSVQHEN